MRIERDKFLSTLELVKAGLSPREFIEQSSCFVFQDGMVMTFNDEVACRMGVGIDVTGAVQANALLDILGKIEDPELKVRQNDKGELEFRGQMKGFGVTMDKEIFLPIDRVEMPEKWHPLPKEFTEAIGLVRHCVSSDESRFILTCVHLAPDFIEACDNLQVMRVKIKTGLKRSVLVRGTSIAHITSLAMTQIAMTQAWVHFKNEAGLVFSCRRYTEEYPSVDKVMDVKGHPITIPKGLKEAAERAAVFATDRSGDALVNINLSSGRLAVTGDGLSGWYKEVKSIVYDGPGMVFVISPELLKHIAEQYQEAVISPGRLKVAGGVWDYVTVLGKPKEEEEGGEEEDPKPRKKSKGEDTGKDEN